MVYKWYILPIRELYGTYHLLREPGNSIDDVFFPSRESIYLLRGVRLYRSLTQHGPPPKKIQWHKTSWWLNQPIWKIWVKFGSFPQVGVKIEKKWNHHLEKEAGSSTPTLDFERINSLLNFRGVNWDAADALIISYHISSSLSPTSFRLRLGVWKLRTIACTPNDG